MWYNAAMPELQRFGENGIMYRHWPGERTRAVLLLVHGMGAHTSRWDFLAKHFAGHGVASYGIELKGYGRTPERPRGHVDSFDIYYRDILQLLDLAKSENPGKKVFLLGESMGGLIAYVTACLYPDSFSGLIMISPAFGNAMKFPFSAYLKLILFVLFNPQLTIDVPFTSAMCTRDEEYRKIMDANPDEWRQASLKTLIIILFEQLRSKKLGKRLKIPTLFLIAGKDMVVDKHASQKTHNSLGLADKSYIEYPDMHHALSIDSGKEKVFKDLLDWVEKRI